MIRSLWVVLNGILATIVVGIIVIVASLLRLQGGIYDWCGRSWSRWILWAAPVRVREIGREHVRRDAPQVLVGNHASWFDVFAVAQAMDKPFHFVAKKELEKVPIFGTAWKAAGHISIDRSDRDRAIASLDRAAAQLREENAAVVIFAEGTRSPTGELLPFKKGAFVIAIQSGVEIVPFAVSGSRDVLPKGRWRVGPGTITVRFGEPVPTAGLTEEDRDRLTREVRQRVRSMLDEDTDRAGPDG